MTPAEVASNLRSFNEWRRGDEDIPQPDPRVIGEAIDAAVEMIDRLEAAEKERDDLKAKIAEMEKQEPVATVIKEGDSRYWMSERLWTFPNGEYPLYALPGAQGEEEE